MSTRHESSAEIPLNLYGEVDRLENAQAATLAAVEFYGSSRQGYEGPVELPIIYLDSFKYPARKEAAAAENRRIYEEILSSEALRNALGQTEVREWPALERTYRDGDGSVLKIRVTRFNMKLAFAGKERIDSQGRTIDMEAALLVSPRFINDFILEGATQEEKAKFWYPT